MKGFIFDLDGTLLNSIADLGHSLNTVLARYNLPVHSLDTYCNFVGNGMKMLVERATSEQDDRTLILHDFLVEYAQRSCEASVLYEGIANTLEILAKRGHPLAICTNKKQEYTDKIISHYLADTPFAMVVGDRFDGRQKPDSYYPLMIAEKMNCNPEDIYFVGDSNVDMQTAHNSGMIAIGVTWGFRSVAELKANKAFKIINRAEELLTLS